MSEDTFNLPFTLELDYFLVCGLRSLGQHCVNALAEFQVKLARSHGVLKDTPSDKETSPGSLVKVIGIEQVVPQIRLDI